jgi:hemin uptake protein HemP
MRRTEVATDESLARTLLEPPAAGSTAAGARAVPPTPRRIASEQLFGGAVEVQIEHRGALYRLKQTALGKLILTK